MAIRTLRCAVEQVADWHRQLFLESHVAAIPIALAGLMVFGLGIRLVTSRRRRG